MKSQTTEAGQKNVGRKPVVDLKELVAVFAEGYEDMEGQEFDLCVDGAVHHFTHQETWSERDDVDQTETLEFGSDTTGLQLVFQYYTEGLGEPGRSCVRIEDPDQAPGDEVLVEYLCGNTLDNGEFVLVDPVGGQLMTRREFEQTRKEASERVAV